MLLIIVSSLCYAQRGDLTGLKFCFDPGHGGHSDATDRHVIPDVGTNFYESESNFQKALWLKPMLEAKGAWVILTRYTNDYPNDADEPSLTSRWTLANTNNVHWFHSIHSNATGGTNTSTNYTLVLIKENIATRAAAFPADITMAGMIYQNIRTNMRTSAWSGSYPATPGVSLDYTFYGGANGGFNLGVLNGLTMPGELSEGEFHDYYPETRRMMNNDYLRMEAYALRNSFLQYYGAPFDTLGVIAGFQKNGTAPINNIVIRLLPKNIVYRGDAYNNGFYMFDSLAPGTYTVRFETPGIAVDSVFVTIPRARTILSATPLQGATAIARNAQVAFTFVMPMDTAAVRSAWSISPALPGLLSWNSQRTVLTFTPSGLMDYKTMYSFSLDKMGNSPSPTYFVDNKTVSAAAAGTGGAYVLSFQTVALPPFVSLTQPLATDTSFDVTRNIGIRFSEAMDTASVRTALSITPKVEGALTWLSSNTTLLFKQAANLAYGTTYTFTIAGTARAATGAFLDGNKDTIPGDPYSFSFRTETQPTAVERNGAALPGAFALHQNFPNPFNPSTTLRFDLPERADVSVVMYDALGRRVAELLHETMDAGYYSVPWNASALSSGTYYCVVRAGEKHAVRALLLLK
ncbi:MAG: Ig-like domain-containing protein [Ignavibacteriales bacterium]|nr:Ig-like domain-containing protein [Ignavibacteriales bacterium]